MPARRPRSYCWDYPAGRCNEPLARVCPRIRPDHNLPPHLWVRACSCPLLPAQRLGWHVRHLEDSLQVVQVGHQYHDQGHAGQGAQGAGDGSTSAPASARTGGDAFSSTCSPTRSTSGIPGLSTHPSASTRISRKS